MAWPGDNWDNDRNRSSNGVRYGVLFGILCLVFLLILAMWFHARQRIRRGQGPMAYHRWLVARPHRYPHHATQPQHPPPMPARDFSFYNHNQQQQQGTNMGPVPPPPLYTPTPYSPPGYGPKMRGGEGGVSGGYGGGGEGSLQRPVQAHTNTADVGPPEGPPPEYRG